MLTQRILFTSLILLLVGLPVLFLSDNKGLLFVGKFLIFASVAIPIVTYVVVKTIGLVRAKALLINVVILGITTILCLGVAEIFVRYLFDDITTTGDNTSYFAQRWKENHLPLINQYGFREREISKQKDPGVYRIAIVGDSYTYGQGIPEDDRFSARIERQLNSVSKRYEVLNFGRPGAETIDHIRMLEDVFEVKPDYILLQWFSNDVEGHQKSGRPKPYRLFPSDYLSGWLHKNSALFYLINAKWSQLQSQTGIIETYQDSMLRRFSDPDSADSRRANQELNEFIALVKNSNIPTGIVMFPNLVETGNSVENYPYGFLFDRVMDACVRNDIQCLDLRPVFAHISPATQLWANRLDPHPGSLANEMAAEAILETFGSQWK